MLLADRLVPSALAPIGNRQQGSGEPSLCCHLPHHVLASHRPAPHVGKAEEVERCTACRRMMLPVRSTEAEVDEPRLLRMECESKPVQPPTQDMEDSLGVKVILKRHHKIIRIPDQDVSSFQVLTDHCREPLIQHVVQVDVREQW
jgi:hypothetical protein